MNATMISTRLFRIICDRSITAAATQPRPKGRPPSLVEFPMQFNGLFTSSDEQQTSQDPGPGIRNKRPVRNYGRGGRISHDLRVLLVFRLGSSAVWQQQNTQRTQETRYGSLCQPQSTHQSYLSPLRNDSGVNTHAVLAADTSTNNNNKKNDELIVVLFGRTQQIERNQKKRFPPIDCALGHVCSARRVRGAACWICSRLTAGVALFFTFSFVLCQEKKKERPRDKVAESRPITSDVADVFHYRR